MAAVSIGTFFSREEAEGAMEEQAVRAEFPQAFAHQDPVSDSLWYVALYPGHYRALTGELVSGYAIGGMLIPQ